jgi:structural maintenance of chromosome 2
VASYEAVVEAATREVAGVEAGDGRDESNKSLQERLQDAQVAQTEADAEAQKCDIRAKGLSKQLIEMSKSLSLKGKEATQLQKDLEQHQAVVKECEAALGALRYDPSEMTRLEGEREGLALQLRKAKEEVERLSHQVSSCTFNYSDPKPGFDRSKVRDD